MKSWLEIQRQSGIDRREVHPLPNNPAIGVADGACPGCGGAPFLVQGSDLRISTRVAPEQLYQSNGRSRCCGEAVGYLYAEASTIFGLEEDRAVLKFGRARVY